MYLFKDSLQRLASMKQMEDSKADAAVRPAVETPCGLGTRWCYTLTGSAYRSFIMHTLCWCKSNTLDLCVAVLLWQCRRGQPCSTMRMLPAEQQHCLPQQIFLNWTPCTAKFLLHQRCLMMCGF
jgi:hypothetical protein